ncbi:MAG: terminase large subunit [Planctomycetota bacterium]
MAKSKTLRQLERDVERYCDDVLSGKRIAGKAERLAIERHRRDLKAAGKRGYVFDPRFSEVAIDWFGQLTFPRGTAAGKPFELHIAQKVMLWILYGWRRKRDLKRRFRRAYISIGRGNGKSPLAGGIASMHFVADVPFQPGAEVVCAATKKAQAEKYVYTPSRMFLESIPELADVLEVKKSPHCVELHVGETIGELYPLGRDSSNDGGNYHVVVRDELHAMREMHRDFCETLETGLKSDTCLMIDITTAGNDRSVLWIPEYDFAKKMLNGIVEADHLFAYIFEIDEDDNPFDTSHRWPAVRRMLQKANPLLDVAIDSETIREEWKKAKVTPSKRNQFIRYRGNRRVSAHEKAFPPELWSKGNQVIPPLRSMKCHGGLDLGGRNDLASFALVFPFELDGETHYAVKAWAWLPEETEHHDLTGEPYQSWIAAGLLRVTNGNTTDDRAIVRTILECRKRFDLLTIAADGNNARTVLNELTNEHDIDTYEFPQNPRKYNEPVNLWLDALDEGRVHHGGNPLLAWAADNTVLREDSAGLVMPEKPKAKSPLKIDPIVASLMAFSETLFSEVTQSAYEERGIRVL